jgi:photosystem II stability/assembly factor-like uncharacterized protein
MIITILVLALAACSPPQTYPLLDSAESAGSSQSGSPLNQDNQSQNSKTNSQPLWISQLKMFDSQNGWGLDDLGRILRTTEGASLWRDVSPAQPDPKTFITPAFLNIDKAVVVYYTPDTDKFESWITEDGGNIWMKGNPLPNSSPGILTPVDLFFLNSHHGWFAAQFNPSLEGVEIVIYESRDGGLNWDLVHISLPQNGGERANELPGSLVMPNGNLLVFTNETRGFAGNGSLYQTVDGGRNWELVFLEPPDESLFAENPYLYVTPPAFITFSEGVLMMTVFNSTQLNQNPDVLPAPPIAAYVFFTNDGGHSWSGIETPAVIGRAQFITPNVGWYLGKDDPAPGVIARLYKTTDSGKTWQLVNENLPLPLGTQLIFINEVDGYAYNLYASRQQNVYKTFDERAGTTPYLYQTSDGGLTWEEIEPFLALKNEKSPKTP